MPTSQVQRTAGLQMSSDPSRQTIGRFIIPVDGPGKTLFAINCTTDESNLVLVSRTVSKSGLDHEVFDHHVIPVLRTTCALAEEGGNANVD